MCNTQRSLTPGWRCRAPLCRYICLLVLQVHRCHCHGSWLGPRWLCMPPSGCRRLRCLHRLKVCRLCPCCARYCMPWMPRGWRVSRGPARPSACRSQWLDKHFKLWNYGRVADQRICNQQVQLGLLILVFLGRSYILSGSSFELLAGSSFDFSVAVHVRVCWGCSVNTTTERITIV